MFLNSSARTLSRRRNALLSTSTALTRYSFAVLLASSAGLGSTVYADTLDGAGQSGFDTNIPLATQVGRDDTVNITIGNTSGTVTLGTDLVLPGSATGIQLNFIADTGTPRETARFIVNDGATLEIGDGAAIGFGNNGWFNVGYGSGQTGSVLLSGGTVHLTNAGNVSYLDVGNAGTGTFTQTAGSVILDASAFQVGAFGGTGVYNLEGGSVTLNPLSTIYIGRATGGDGTLNISGDATLTASAQVFIGGYQGGTGKVVQDGAQTLVSIDTGTGNDIVIGSASGTGTYELHSGTFELLSTRGVTFGQGAGATGIFTQTGGDFTAAGLVSMGNGGSASYAISAGSSTMNGGLRLANGGTGSLIQTDDPDIEGAPDVVIGGTGITFGGGGGAGTYELSGGTLTLAGITGGNANSHFIFGGGTLIASQSFNTSTGFATALTDGTASTLDTGAFTVGWASPISGSGALTKTGAGILALSGANGFTGDLDITAGTLGISSDTNLGATSSELTLDGGTLQASATATLNAARSITLGAGNGGFSTGTGIGLTVNGVIGGTGGLTKAGLGTVTLGGDNSFTGDVAVSEGTLSISNYAALQGNNVSIADGATLSLQPLAAGTLPTTVLTGEVTGAGTIDLGEAWFTTTVGAGRTVAFEGSILSDTQGYEPNYGRFTKDGAGTLNISGSEMIKGEAYVIGGSLLQASGTTSWDVLAVGSGAGGTGALNVTGGDIDFGVGLRVGDWGGTGSVVQTGGTVSVIPDCGITANCASLNIGNQGGTGTYTISGGTLTLADGRHAIGRNAGTNSGGAGTLQIDGGLVELAAGNGVLIIGDPDRNTAGTEARGTLNQTAGTIRVGDGFRVYLGGWGVSQYNFSGGTLEVGGAGLNGDYSGPSDYTFNFGDGVIDVTGSALATTVKATLTDGTTATIDTNLLGASWGGVLSGAGSLVKLGESTLTLGAANTFTGDVAIDEGTLALSNAGALNGNNVTLAAGTTLSLDPLAASANVLAGEISGTATSTIDLGDSGLVTTVGNGRTASYSGSITSANPAYAATYGRFIKAGAGDLDISGATMSGGEGLVAGGRLLQTTGTTNWDTLAVGSGAGNTGNMTVSGGEISFGVGLRVGDWGGTGSVTQTGGTVKVEATCGDDERCAALNIGNQGGTGTYTISSGALRLVGGSNSIGRNTSQAGGTGTLQINGGVVSVEAHSDPEFGNGALTIGDLSASSVAEASGIINQTGGILRMGAGSALNLAGYGSGTYNLNGGTLEIGGNSLRGALAGNSEGTYAFNLGGGIIDVTGSALATAVNATLTAATTSTIDTNALGATWSGVLSGDGSLVKTGAGTLTLSGYNTFTGNLTVDQGTLMIGVDAHLGAVSSDLILNDGTLAVSAGVTTAAGRTVTLGAEGGTFDSGSDFIRVTDGIGGTGGLTKTGIGALFLTGANTYAGGTTISEGTLVIQSAATTLVGNIANEGAVSLEFTAAGPARTFSNVISGTGTVEINGYSDIIFDTDQTYTGMTYVWGRSLQIGAGGTTGSVAGDIHNEAALSFNRSDDFTYAGAITGDELGATLTKMGGNTLTLTGASSFAGAVNVEVGTLLLDGGELSGGGTVTVSDGATFGGAGSVTGAVIVLDDGTLTNASAGAQLTVGSLSLNSTSTVQAYLGTTSQGAIYNITGDVTLDGNLDILSAANGAGVYTLMTYGGSLTSNGMNIDAVPEGFRAGLYLNAGGEVRVGLADAAGYQSWTASGSTTLGGSGFWISGGQTWLDDEDDVVTAWGGTVGVFDGTAGTVTVSGVQQFKSLEFITTGYTLTPQNGSAGLNFTDGGQLWAEGAGVTATVGTTISGTGGLKKVGAGTVILSGTNSYTGGTRVEAGTLSVSSDANLGVGGITLASGGTLSTSATLSTARAVTLDTGGTLNIANAGNSLILVGSVSGTGGLTKTGAGTLILTSANTYTGGTTISGGSLILGDDTTTGSIIGNVAVNGTTSSLAFNRSNTLTFAGNISGDGNIRQDGTGTLTLSGTNTYTGVTSVTQGVLVAAGGNAIGDTSLLSVAAEARLAANETVGNIYGNGTIDIASYTLTTGGAGGTVGFGGSVDGSGSLVKTGSGTVILGGVNTYTGTTTVLSGTLASTGAALSDTALLSVEAGATARFQGASETIGSLAGAGTVALRGVTLILGGDNSSTTFSGAFVDDISAGGFTKTGTGTFAVSGISTNAGDNAVEAGTLLVSGTLGSGALNVASGATLTGSGSIGGAVTVESGGTLAGGYLGGLTMGALTLQAGATTNITLDAPDAPDSIFYIDGALNAAGTLNVAGTPQYGTGVYRVFAATGGVTDNGLALGTTPYGGIDTALAVSANAIDLQVTEIGEALQYWSANGSSTGGSGTWTASNLWLYPGGRPDIWLGNVAIFDGAAGTITVNGAQSFQTLEFMTDGYVVATGTNGSLDIGGETGRIWAEGTDITATISAPITGAGGLMKVGAGTVVLGGTNTYAGGTAITEGTLSVSSDANLGAAAGGITLNGGTLAATASFASARAVELLAAPIFARAPAPSISGGIIDTVGAPTTLTLSGVISGKGDLVKTGLGTLILTGDNTYTGLTTISEGTLQIGNGGTSGTVLGDIVNDALLVFARSDTYAFPGSISGTGTVNFNGGTVLFASPDAFTGPINVNGSMVELVDGSVSYSPFTINEGGIIGGSGTIGGLTVNSGGTVAPGYSPGTLNVIGNVAFNAGSTYAVDVTPDGAHDLITAGGSVTISGGSAVEVLAEAGVYAASQTYAIITANGTVTGAFGTVSSDFAFLTPSLSYDAQNVYLTLDYNNIDFAAFATTPNQAATATAAQSLGFDNPVFDAIFAMSADELPAAFNSLSGEIGASAKGVLIGDSQFVRNAVFERLVTAGSVAPSGMSVAPLGYAAPAKPQKAGDVPYPTKAEPLDIVAPTSAVWAQGFGSWGSTDGNGNAASIDRSTGGFLIGADTLVGDWRLGVLGGYSQTSFDVDARASSGESDNIHAGLYAGTNWGAVNFRAGASYTWNDISTSRNVNIPTPQLLEADYDAGTAQVFGELGYGLTFGAVDFEPFAGLAYVNLHTDGFSETGGPAALTSSSDSTDATYTTLGLRASTTLNTGSFATTLRGMLGWRHAFGDITPTTSYQFAAGGSPFTVEGLPIAEDALVLDLGLDVAISDAASLGVFYSAQFGDSAQDQSVRGTLNWKF